MKKLDNSDNKNSDIKDNEKLDLYVYLLQK